MAENDRIVKLEAAIVSNSLKDVQLLLKRNVSQEIISYTFVTVSQYGNLAIFQWLLSRFNAKFPKICFTMAQWLV